MGRGYPTRTNDHKVVLKFIKEHIFSCFGVPRAIINDGGLHFCNRSFENLLKKYGVTHKVSTAYHPQTNGPLGFYALRTMFVSIVGLGVHWLYLTMRLLHIQCMANFFELWLF